MTRFVVMAEYIGAMSYNLFLDDISPEKYGIKCLP